MNARNWKWMVPGGGFGILLLVTYWLMLSPAGWVRMLAVVSGIWMMLCGIASVGNLMDYRRAMAVVMLERKKKAMAVTSLSVRLEAARGVHPDSVKLIMNEYHRVWALRNGNLDAGIRAHDVLYHAPEVTIIFLEFFLKSSTERSVMPKRSLVQGRKNRFDPYGAVEEYVMYDRLVQLLVKQGKLHKWTEFDALYEWVEPWSPRLVAEEWGLVWEEEEQAVSVQLSADVER